MSKRPLTDAQILLLSKGLSFVPTPKDANNFELLKDFDQFCNKIRFLSRCKHTHRRNNNSKFPRKKKQQRRPRRDFHSSTDLEGVLEEIKLEISRIATMDKIPYNLTLKERKALWELKCNSDLVINKADKGSTIVVQDRADYIRDALEHLNDPNTYKELDGDPTNSICRGINQVLQRLHSEGLLDKSMVDFCSPPKRARLARLYFLKKTHKTPMGIRPIVSSCESPTENISQFIDYWLQPIMKGLPSYIKNTTELINQLNELVIPQDVLLVTVDVKSLYTCIPHREGIQACAEALEEPKTTNSDQPDTNTLIKLLKIVLCYNTFEFNNKSYIQLQGTAMGTKLAPAYANIFMNKLEQTILSSTPFNPIYYKRYIDDIFILWPHSITDLDKFITELNSYHPLVKFTTEYSYEKITFLDINIFKGPNFETTRKLDTETYIKPTNKQAYIHANSFHPPGASKGVAIGEMKRYLRTNSRADSFCNFKHKHRHNLLKRGYSKHFVSQYTNNIHFKHRSLALKLKPRIDRKRIAFVTRFTPSAAKAMKIIKKFWPSLRGTKSLKHTRFPSPMLTYKSNKNIKSHLVRAKLKQINDDNNVINQIEFNITLDDYNPIPEVNSTS